MSGPSEPSLVFADENPGLLLTSDGHARLAASLWRSSFSPAGGGHVLALAQTPARASTEPSTAAPARRCWVFTDNDELAALVVATFLNNWDLFDGDDLTSAQVSKADFTVTITARSWTLACTSETLSAQIRWADLAPPATHPVHGHPGVLWQGRPLLVDHHVSLAGRVEVLIDDRPLHTDMNLATAYVTVAETWFAGPSDRDSPSRPR